MAVFSCRYSSPIDVHSFRFLWPQVFFQIKGHESARRLRKTDSAHLDLQHSPRGIYIVLKRSPQATLIVRASWSEANYEGVFAHSNKLYKNGRREKVELCAHSVGHGTTSMTTGDSDLNFESCRGPLKLATMMEKYRHEGALLAFCVAWVAARFWVEVDLAGPAAFLLLVSASAIALEMIDVSNVLLPFRLRPGASPGVPLGVITLPLVFAARAVQDQRTLIAGHLSVLNLWAALACGAGMVGSVAAIWHADARRLPKKSPKDPSLQGGGQVTPHDAQLSAEWHADGKEELATAQELGTSEGPGKTGGRRRRLGASSGAKDGADSSGASNGAKYGANGTAKGGVQSGADGGANSRDDSGGSSRVKSGAGHKYAADPAEGRAEEATLKQMGGEEEGREVGEEEEEGEKKASGRKVGREASSGRLLVGRGLLGWLAGTVAVVAAAVGTTRGGWAAEHGGAFVVATWLAAHSATCGGLLFLLLRAFPGSATAASVQKACLCASACVSDYPGATLLKTCRGGAAGGPRGFVQKTRVAVCVSDYPVVPLCSTRVHAGEALLVAQGVTHYGLDALARTLAHVAPSVPLPPHVRSGLGGPGDEIDAVIQAMVVGILLLPLCTGALSRILTAVTSRRKRAKPGPGRRSRGRHDWCQVAAFYLSLLLIVAVLAPMWLRHVRGLQQNPLACNSCCRPAGLSLPLEEDISAEFGVGSEPEFLRLAFGVALAAFLLLEIVRVRQVAPFGRVVDDFMKAFVDSRDSGAVIVRVCSFAKQYTNAFCDDAMRVPVLSVQCYLPGSHFSLLLGCALPLWLSVRTPDRPLAPFAGVLSLGIGDTLASVVGVRYGRHKMTTHSRKSVEGTTAGIASMAASCALLAFLLPHAPATALEWLGAGAATAVAGLLEAYTTQLDNAFVPLVYFALLCF
eukprot:jgi/Mesen1/2373/ME000156S01520